MIFLFLDTLILDAHWWSKVRAFEYEIKETTDENKVFLLMEKGLEDNVDDIEDNAYDDAGDGKTHLKVRRKKQVMAKQMTGEKKKTGVLSK